MNTEYTYTEKPTLVNVIAWTTLASGIVNIGWGLATSAAAVLTVIGICCTPLTILPAILGIFEIIYAAKLLSSPPQAVRPATNLAILEIVCILTGNVFSMIVGIVSLVFYNDSTVKEYFTRLNGGLPPTPVSPAPQVPPIVPTTTVDELVSSPIVSEEPFAAEGPVTPPAPVEEFIPSPLTGEPETPVPPVPPDAPASSDPRAQSFPTEEPPEDPERPAQ